MIAIFSVGLVQSFGRTPRPSRTLWFEERNGLGFQMICSWQLIDMNGKHNQGLCMNWILSEWQYLASVQLWELEGYT